MFERFSGTARQALAVAREEAQSLGGIQIDTEHILLGLAHERRGTAAQVLESVGIGWGKARQQVRRATGRTEAPSDYMPFTSDAKKALDGSLRESVQRGHHYVGTAHVLLGLAEQVDSEAARTLVRLGADLKHIREQATQGLMHDREAREPSLDGEVSQVMARASGQGGDAAITPDSGEIARLHAEIAWLRALLRRHGIDPGADPSQS